MNLGNGGYSITELIIDQKSPRKNFSLLVYPRNGTANKAEIASGPTDVTLVDEHGVSYVFIGTRTRWGRDNEAHRVAWQQLSFEGAPVAGATELNLHVQGIGRVVGPFIFKGVSLP